MDFFTLCHDYTWFYSKVFNNGTAKTIKYRTKYYIRLYYTKVCGCGSPMILDGISRYGALFQGIDVISELPTV